MNRRAALEAEYRRHAATDVLGRVIEWYDELPSTNERARALAAERVSEGALVVADEQTAGRGRLGRTWYSPAAGGLWFSVVLYPTQSMAELPGLTVMAAEALKSCLKKHLDLTVTIKEPNDLLVGRKKVCGILAEASTKAGCDVVDYVVLGIGLNCSTTFPDDLRDVATSLADVVAAPLPPRSELLARVAEALEERYLL